MKLLLAALMLAGGAAQARTLTVGPGADFATLAAAAARARAGDRVTIAPGRYGCAVWRADGLTITGQGDSAAVVIEGPVCEGKALFVTAGRGITVANLTLAGASSVDENGAGIRAEGADLTVDRVRFVRDQDGILSTSDPQSTILVRHSVFDHDGFCGRLCAHGIYANHVGRLIVTGSVFRDTQQGHGIKSRAFDTEVTGCTITDGAHGTSSYAIDAPNGGRVTVQGNTLQKGPRTGNNSAAISIGEEGALQPGAIVVEHNRFANESGRPTSFVVNRTDEPAVLQGNALTGPVTPLTGPGSVR